MGAVSRIGPKAGFLWLVMALALGGHPTAQEPLSSEAEAPQPARDFRDSPLEYPGPPGEEPAMDELDELVIGWFGPADPADPDHGDLWTAAVLALEEANEAGGYQGIPFRLEPRWSQNPWGTGVAQLARLVYERQIWAILGAVDGGSAHLVEQVVAKARLPFVSPVSTDKSVNLAGVPWMFSLAPGDHLWAPPLAAAVLRELEAGADSRLALLSGTDHDSRLAAEEVLRELEARDRGPVLHLEFRGDAQSFANQLQRLEGVEWGVLLIVGGPRDSARLVSAVRDRNPSAIIFGTPRMGRRLFLELAGEAAEGVRFPLLTDPGGRHPDRESFERRFRERTGAEPDWAAASSYDACRLLLAAIRRAGPRRAAIREALVEFSPWPGVTGPVEWDPVGQNLRSVTRMATVRDGSIVPLPPSQDR